MGSKFTFLLTLLVLLIPIAESKEVFNVYVEHLPPNVVVSKGSVKGRAIDIVKEISHITGFKFNIRQVPWARAYHDGLNNPNVVFTGLNRIRVREDNFFWLYKLGYEPQYIWALADNLDKSYKTGRYAFAKADHKLNQFKVYAKKQGFSPEIYTVTTREQAIKMLFANRVDFIVGSERYLNERSKVLSLDFQKVAKVREISADNKGLYIALSKATDAESVDAIKSSIRQLEESGKLTEIYGRWFVQALD